MWFPAKHIAYSPLYNNTVSTISPLTGPKISLFVFTNGVLFFFINNNYSGLI